MKILAADPGLTGALAAYNGETGAIIDTWPMPTYTREIGRAKARDLIDEEALWRLMGAARLLHGCDRFVIEKVGGIPGQSAAGAFTFGWGAAHLWAFARALGMKLERVEPSIWKRAMRCPASKSAARIRASEVFPGDSWRWPKSKDDGHAEAALIAKYAAENLV